MTRTVCIDFDGTIADYSKGYCGRGVFGDPLPGAVQALRKLREEGWTIIIYTCRTEVDLLTAYMTTYGIPHDGINCATNNVFKGSFTKPMADAYVDDRGVHFEGDWVQTLQQIRETSMHRWSGG